MDYEVDEGDFLAEAERRAKQDFLREEVLDKGYDPSHFVVFCENLRGSNVDLWAFDELQQVVREFKQAYRRGEFEANEMNKHSSSSSSSNSRSNSNSSDTPAEVLTGDNDQSKHEPSHEQAVLSPTESEDMPISAPSQPAPHIEAVYTLPCRSPAKTQLAGDVCPRVEVTDPQVVSQSMFTSSYATYLVITSPFGWAVRRRFSDFEWLHKVLVEHFPGRFVSPR